MKMSEKIVLLLFAVFFGACGTVAMHNIINSDAPGYTADKAVGVVILYRDGLAKKSSVHKIGSRCWVDWFKGIEKVILRSDGTAIDSPFRYRWTLDRAGPDDLAADRKWFADNCIDPPGFGGAP